MERPDAHQNPATYIALLGPIIATAVVLFKLDLTQDQQAIMVTALAGVLAVVIPLADAIIRRGRATVVATENQLAVAQLQSMPLEGDDSLVPGYPGYPPAAPIDPKITTQAQQGAGPSTPQV